MNKKVFAFDMDGTITYGPESNQVHPETIRAFKMIKAKGHLLGIATGRPYFDIMRETESINDLFDFYIANNGTYFYDVKAKKFHYSKSLKPELVEKVYEIGKKYGGYIIVHGETHGYRTKIENDKTDFNSPDFDEFKKFTLTSKDELLKIMHTQNIYQIALRLTPGTIDQAFAEYKGIVTDEAVHVSGHAYIDINPNGATKLEGLRKVGAHFNFDLKDVIGFGDSGNDIQMFEGVGLAIAMGNAAPEIQKYADEVIGNNDTDAIAKRVFELI